MYCWRITKYNPKYRNEKGHYLKEEWTFFAQIGTTVEGKKVTFDEYVEIENKYIKAVLLIMECAQIESMQIVGLQKDKKLQKKWLEKQDIEIFNSLKNGQWVDRTIISHIIRLILREKIWCKLESENMYIHFGWDYYMFIGSTKPCQSAIKAIEKNGLFVEPFESPYKEEE